MKSNASYGAKPFESVTPVGQAAISFDLQFSVHHAAEVTSSPVGHFLTQTPLLIILVTSSVYAAPLLNLSAVKYKSGKPEESTNC